MNDWGRYRPSIAVLKAALCGAPAIWVAGRPQATDRSPRVLGSGDSDRRREGSAPRPMRTTAAGRPSSVHPRAVDASIAAVSVRPIAAGPPRSVRPAHTSMAAVCVRTTAAGRPNSVHPGRSHLVRGRFRATDCHRLRRPFTRPSRHLDCGRFRIGRLPLVRVRVDCSLVSCVGPPPSQAPRAETRGLAPASTPRAAGSPT